MIGRRGWLFLVGGGLLAACAGPEDGPRPPDEEGAEPPDPKAVSSAASGRPRTLILTGEGQKIGRSYARKAPAEATVASLRAALPQGVDALTTRIAADYAADEVVVLRGWILARTEARLLALGALQSGQVSL